MGTRTSAGATTSGACVDRSNLRELQTVSRGLFLDVSKLFCHVSHSLIIMMHQGHSRVKQALHSSARNQAFERFAHLFDKREGISRRRQSSNIDNTCRRFQTPPCSPVSSYDQTKMHPHEQTMCQHERLSFSASTRFHRGTSSRWRQSMHTRGALFVAVIIIASYILPRIKPASRIFEQRHSLPVRLNDC
jgi:hypothetical protein